MEHESMSSDLAPERKEPTAQVDEAEEDETCEYGLTSDGPTSIPNGAFSDNVFICILRSVDFREDALAWAQERKMTSSGDKRHRGSGLCQRCYALAHDDLPKLRLSTLKSEQAVIIRLGDLLAESRKECKSCTYLSERSPGLKLSSPNHRCLSSYRGPELVLLPVDHGYFLYIMTADIFYLYPATQRLAIITTSPILYIWDFCIPNSGHDCPDFAFMDGINKRCSTQPSLYGNDDYEDISNWLQHCTTQHEDKCSEALLRQSFVLQCIDCELMKVVKLPTGSRYLSLSYVWGATSVLETGEDLSNIPLVVRDAIRVTLQLSFRFLWVDRYCINQQDATEKHCQIANMGNIYASAALTLIAAGSPNADIGLPGVSSGHRNVDAVFQLGPYSIVPVLSNPKRALGSSIWSTRGWTYQEAAMSPRRLVFLPDGWYSQCNMEHAFGSVHRVWGQTMKRPSRVNFYGSQGSCANVPPTLLFLSTAEVENDRALMEFYDHVSNYLHRSLTYQSDRFNAIQGVLNTFRDRPQPVFNIYGVAFTASQEFPINGGICWIFGFSQYGREHRHRLSLFPSWSWLGWHSANEPASDMIKAGVTVFGLGEDVGMGLDRFTASISVVVAGERLDLTRAAFFNVSLEEILTPEARPSPQLVIQAFVFPLVFLPSEKNGWTLVPKRRLFGGLRSHMWLDQPEETTPEILGHVKGLVLGRRKRHILVIVIRKTNFTWERVGVALFFSVDGEEHAEKQYLRTMKKLKRRTIMLA